MNLMDYDDDNISDTSIVDDFTFEIVSHDDLYDEMQEMIESVRHLLKISRDMARLLLAIFKWNKDKLFEQFFDHDLNYLCEQYKIPLVKLNTFNFNNTYCIICTETVQKQDMILLNCSHYFCRNCCDYYAKLKIEFNAIGIGIICPSTDCSYLIDDTKISEILQDTVVWSSYEEKILNNFIASNKLLRPCPAINCNYVIKVDYIESKPLKCFCETIFCCKCLQDWHESVSCDLLKTWIKKCNDDSDTSNWLAEHTKECPSCGIPIMKDGGCNHIICKNSVCKKHFCWVCLGPWESHGSSWYNCNRYNDEDTKLARDKQTEHRRALNRFLFYSNRYKTHKFSLELEKRLFNIIQEKLLTRQINWNEVEFLQSAIKTLIECRQSLMYTYAFAYYLEKNNQVAIFEENQKDLESATELLSEYLERDINSVDFIEAKQMVQDKYRYCSRRRKILIEHVYEGYEQNWWIFRLNDDQCKVLEL